MGDITTIPLKRGTRISLRDIGKKGESYDTLLNRLIKMYKEEANNERKGTTGPG